MTIDYMSEYRHFVEVLLKDGNRTVNVETRNDYSILSVLIHNEFKWIRNSIRINGSPVRDKELSTTLDRFISGPENAGRIVPRVTITMVAPKQELPKKNENRKEDTEE